MSKIILGHPYSGALYGYISDQIGVEYSHTNSIGNHGYYTTLYGKKYKKFIDQALMLSLIYDKVYLTPADNYWPESPTTQNRDYHPELGLYAEWNTYKSLFNDTSGLVQHYLNDSQIKKILSRIFRIPNEYQIMVLSSILYELNLSRMHRCPIVCSNGRKLIIERLIQIDRPATHPITLNSDKVEVISNYMSATGLFLSPTSLENLIHIKPEPQVREYARSYLLMLENYQALPTKSNQLAILELSRNAIEKEKISTLASGLFNWLGTLFRLIGSTPLSLASKGGSFAANWSADNAKWYALSGEIRKAESKAVLVRSIEKMERMLSVEDV